MANDREDAIHAFINDAPKNWPGIDLTLNAYRDGFMDFQTARAYAWFLRGFLLGRGWHD